MDALMRLGELGVVPVVKIEKAGDGPRLADALVQGGLPCAEITFRTEAAEQTIRLIGRSHPELVLGAGTVLSVEQAARAVAAGACFIVSPGFDPAVVDWCLEQQVAVIPGIATATEALMGLSKGLRILKFFPSEALGGIPMLQAMSAALVGMKFLPTGGVSPSNLATYLQCPVVHAVAGTWLATSKMISSGSFAEIVQLAAQAVATVRSVRENGVMV